MLENMTEILDISSFQSPSVGLLQTIGFSIMKMPGQDDGMLSSAIWFFKKFICLYCIEVSPSKKINSLNILIVIHIGRPLLSRLYFYELPKTGTSNKSTNIWGLSRPLTWLWVSCDWKNTENWRLGSLGGNLQPLKKPFVKRFLYE